MFPLQELFNVLYIMFRAHQTAGFFLFPFFGGSGWGVVVFFFPLVMLGGGGGGPHLKDYTLSTPHSD